MLRKAFAGLAARHPVFRRRAERSGTSWRWVDDPGFDVAQHVIEVDLPDGAGMSQVQDYVAEQRSVPLDRDRPLWTAALLRPVELDDGTSGSVVVTRSHHAIADGVRLTQVLLAMLDPENASDVPAVVRAGTSGGSTLSVGALLAVPGEAARIDGVARCARWPPRSVGR